MSEEEKKKKHATLFKLLMESGCLVVLIYSFRICLYLVVSEWTQKLKSRLGQEV